MKRLVGGVFVSLAAIAVAAWAPSGCATREPAGPQPADPRLARDYEPDGGWQNYRPTGKDVERERDTSPNGPIGGGPILPITPGGSSVPPTVH